jgi:hypothetical protein
MQLHTLQHAHAEPVECLALMRDGTLISGASNIKVWTPAKEDADSSMTTTSTSTTTAHIPLFTLLHAVLQSSTVQCLHTVRGRDDAAPGAERLLVGLDCEELNLRVLDPLTGVTVQLLTVDAADADVDDGGGRVRAGRFNHARFCQSLLALP